MRHIYVRQQIFVLCFAAGIFLIGVGFELFPTPKSTDIVLGGLPTGWRHAWYALYIASGGLLCLGILRANPRLEASGHAVITSLFAATTYLELANVPEVSQVVSSVALTVLLTLGSGFRFWLLIRYAPETSMRHGP